MEVTVAYRPSVASESTASSDTMLLSRKHDHAVSTSLTISALVCTRGRGELAAETVASILRPESICLELIVVDQSVDDATLNSLRPFSGDSRFRYIRSATQGKGAALNLGLQEAKGDIVALTDDDCQVIAPWPAGFLRIFEHHPKAVVCFGGVMPVDFDMTAGFIPAYTIPYNRCIRSLWQKRSARGLGANMAVRRKEALELGGFDPQLCPGGAFGAFEDGDMQIRSLLAGYEAWEVQNPLVYHAGFRTWEQGRALASRSFSGTAASFAKAMKCGHIGVAPLAAYEFGRYALLPFLWGSLTRRRQRGYYRVSGFVEGFLRGLSTPSHRKTVTFTSDLSSAPQGTK